MITTLLIEDDVLKKKIFEWNLMLRIVEKTNKLQKKEVVGGDCIRRTDELKCS